MTDAVSTVDKIRYGVALLVEIGMPPALLYWFLVHPFTRFWRRLGVRPSLVLLFGLMAGIGYGMYLIRRPLLAVDFGFQWPLAVPAVLLYVARVRTEFKIRRQLKGRILAGIPEIEGDAERSPLLTEGVYSRSRNPRYLNLMIIMIAFALATNYLYVWATTAVTPLVIYLIVRLEEKELLQRYGDEYRSYCERVPRFV
ncbi:MAG: methyltransferase [Acidobacteriota bacterium]|nr:methyltransferase [Acidobacteriota bacterium]